MTVRQTLVFGITLSERAMTDGLSVLYQELLSGSYDCVDRIVLNAYFGMGHSPGGFRVWWRALTGSDETLDNAHLMRLAGRFSRRVRGYSIDLRSSSPLQAHICHRGGSPAYRFPAAQNPLQPGC